MENLFNIENFNIIEDGENYYFFRALNMADNKDLEEGIIANETGDIKKIRTDRERYEANSVNGAPKYNKDSKITLEQVYDHIKMHYRKDTNCISLSSNCNVSILYGRGYYKDKYIMVKVPKKDFGKKVINAGEYILEEIVKKVNEYLLSINDDSKVIELLSEIESSKTPRELSRIIEKRYTSKEKIDLGKSKVRKGITYKLPIKRISSYKALNEEQSLEKNKIIAKLTLFERKMGMPPIIPYTANNNLLIQTIERAFSSLEFIHYGDIEKEEIINIPKEVVDIFALLQQVEGKEKKTINELKKEVIRLVNEGKSFEIPAYSRFLEEYDIRDEISIEEMYGLAGEKVEYGIANSILKKVFYLAKSQSNARELSKVINQITGDDPRYREAIQYISNNGFRIEPNIMTKRNNKGIRLSESVNFELKSEEIDLIDKIKGLSGEEQIEIIKSGGISDVKNIIKSTFSKLQRNERISKEEYYAEAIFSLYDWKKTGIEEFTTTERNNLIKKIQNEYCVDLYQKLEKRGIDRSDIPKVLLNMVTRKVDFQITQQDATETIKEKRLEQYDRMINESMSDINQELSIEKIGRFLG